MAAVFFVKNNDKKTQVCGLIYSDNNNPKNITNINKQYLNSI